MASLRPAAATAEALAGCVAADFAAYVRETLARQERFTWVLAGGVTPRLFYSNLAKPPLRDAIPWERLWLYWGDERCVPKDHPDSNFRMVEEALLQHVPVRASQVFRMRGEDPPPQAARDYEKIVRDRFPGAVWPAFDLVLLGMGVDGHIVSLMPGTAALTEYSFPGEKDRRKGETGEPAPPRWVVHNVIRQLQTVRLTMTLPVINHARQVWFLVTGGKKAEAYERAQGEPTAGCPGSLVRPESGELRWYVDQAVVEKVIK